MTQMKKARGKTGKKRRGGKQAVYYLVRGGGVEKNRAVIRGGGGGGFLYSRTISSKIEGSGGKLASHRKEVAQIGISRESQPGPESQQPMKKT